MLVLSQEKKMLESEQNKCLHELDFKKAKTEGISSF